MTGRGGGRKKPNLLTKRGGEGRTEEESNENIGNEKNEMRREREKGAEKERNPFVKNNLRGVRVGRRRTRRRKRGKWMKEMRSREARGKWRERKETRKRRNSFADTEREGKGREVKREGRK